MPATAPAVSRHALAMLLLACGGAQAATPAPAACSAQSARLQTPLVELYTSEGCSSCPPADRWLSTLPTGAAVQPGTAVPAQPAVLAAAFHVSYWDRLGWPDRFAHAEFTARQRAVAVAAGARQVYTPQVLVNGRDWRGWPVLPLPSAAPARASITLQRRGAQVAVQVLAGPGAPARLGLWWALLEDGHGSAVTAGENQGAQLRHDHVVRRYAELPAWPARVGSAQPHLLQAEAHGEGGRLARLLVVVTDAATGAPLQAVQLACAATG